jgi:3',5'-nucleoside bisphosphate phosphatase
MRVDLHMHSTASDGVYAPEDVVKIAHTNGLDVIALTDHDNVSGVEAAVTAALALSLEVVAGVELSCVVDDAKVDILGYLLDIHDIPLQTTLRQLRNARVDRIRGMVDKLAALGVSVSVERVLALSDAGSVGRPHLARALVESGYASSIQDAFTRYIGDDSPAYVPHFELHAARAIELIHSAGGVAVLAHPGHYARYEMILDALAPQGLDGVEVYYYDHSPALIEELRIIARRHNLIMTVGSDFHRREGDGSARIGTVKYPADLDVVNALKAKAAGYRKRDA